MKLGGRELEKMVVIEHRDTFFTYMIRQGFPVCAIDERNYASGSFGRTAMVFTVSRKTCPISFTRIPCRLISAFEVCPPCLIKNLAKPMLLCVCGGGFEFNFCFHTCQNRLT